MKKLSLMLIGAGLMSVVACGPSAEEKAAAEKQTADSLAAVDAARIQDSIANAEKAAQEMMMAAQKATEDSLKMVAMQDSLDALKTKVKKAAPKKAAAPAPKTSVEKNDKASDAKYEERFGKKK